MKVDANAVYYLLTLEFDDVVGHLPSRGPLVDYPLLYDENKPASGHALLLPENVSFEGRPVMQNVVCVCTSDQAMSSAVGAGYPAVQVRDDIELHQLYNSMLRTYVRHERFEAQLRAYVEAHAGFRPILDACAEAMLCACALVDERFHLIWQADGRKRAGVDAEPLLDDSTIDLFMASRDYRMKRASNGVFAAPGSDDLFMKNLYADGKLVGTLAVAHDGDMASARYARFLLELLVPYVEEMYLRRGSFGTASMEADRIRSLISTIIAGKTTVSDEVDLLLSGSKKEPEAKEKPRYAMLRFARNFTNEENELYYLIERIELAWSRVYCVVSQGCLLALADLDGPSRDRKRDFLQDVALFSRDALLKVGMSRPFSSCSQLGAASMQASAALEEGQAKNPTFWFYRFEDYALPWFIAHGQGDYPAEYVAHPAIVKLAHYDSQHDSNLLETLRVFMSCRYNASEAAAQLYVARSTLLNRLARMKELALVDLDDPDERLYLGISLKLLDSSPGM